MHPSSARVVEIFAPASALEAAARTRRRCRARRDCVGSCPVMIVTCDGSVSGTAVRAFAKRTPRRRARRSPASSPRPIRSARSVSMVMRTMFGGWGSGSRRGSWPKRPAPRRERVTGVSAASGAGTRCSAESNRCGWPRTGPPRPPRRRTPVTRAFAPRTGGAVRGQDPQRSRIQPESAAPSTDSAPACTVPRPSRRGTPPARPSASSA